MSKQVTRILILQAVNFSELIIFVFKSGFVHLQIRRVFHSEGSFEKPDKMNKILINFGIYSHYLSNKIHQFLCFSWLRSNITCY